MGSEDVALSAHVAIAEGGDWPLILAAAQRMLRQRFNIGHVTLQPDWAAAAPAGRKVIPVKALD
jgi:cobalt-zinc-cadmium efflux system protein